MTVWVIDASVLLASEDADDRNHAAATGLLAGNDPLASVDLAFYEVVNVAVRAWKDMGSVTRLMQRLEAIADDGGIVRADSALLDVAATTAEMHGISVYDAAYVAAAARLGGRLVSCDERDLVSRGLACLPHETAPRS